LNKNRKNENPALPKKQRSRRKIKVNNRNTESK
jgi:hypothetical protein